MSPISCPRLYIYTLWLKHTSTPHWQAVCHAIPSEASVDKVNPLGTSVFDQFAQNGGLPNTGLPCSRLRQWLVHNCPVLPQENSPLFPPLWSLYVPRLTPALRSPGQFRNFPGSVTNRRISYQQGKCILIVADLFLSVHFDAKKMVQIESDFKKSYKHVSTSTTQPLLRSVLCFQVCVLASCIMEVFFSLSLWPCFPHYIISNFSIRKYEGQTDVSLNKKVIFRNNIIASQ